MGSDEARWLNGVLMCGNCPRLLISHNEIKDKAIS